jgi:flavin-dependent thymidylate synthase
MKILLAGYNIDYDLICELKDKSELTQDITPETISAAYARISRSPKTVDELRKDARTEVDKARKSNRNIVFEMGHSSVAEHAVFNIDVIGVSRLLVEEIEKFRLCSYTEKSQRYVLFDKDFVMPDEMHETGLADLFVETVAMQNDCYHQLYEQLRPYVFEKNKPLAYDPANKSMLEGWAKEDARYAIALATETQLGMTINARNLELMLRRLSALPLAEARLYSAALYAATKDIAPSLIRYTEATAYDRLTRQNVKTHADKLLMRRPCAQAKIKSRDVELVSCTPKADLQTAAALLFSTSTLDYNSCRKQAARMTPRNIKGLFKTVFANAQSYDAVLRELENADLQFEMTMSASCFAQLKRHRMATVITQDYDPGLGVTIPPAVRAIGRQKAFMDVIRKTNDVYNRIRQKNPAAAAYVLTNAHRKRVLMKLNAREMYHITRLRADAHAQWDIRDLSEKMLRQARKVMPLSLMMACGKDGFAAQQKKLFP